MNRPGDERGSVSTELAAVMGVFFAGFLMLVVFAGRNAQAENDVRSAAHDAARAASLTANPSRAEAEARQAAEKNLTTSGMSCRNGLTVTIDAEQFRPGGWVAVAVTCHTSFADVASLAVPGDKTFTATATEVIDAYRADNQ